MMKLKIYKILPLLLACIAIASCSSIDCEVNSLVQCIYGFRDTEGNAVTLVSPITVTTFRSIDGNDTVLINNQSNSTQLALPMSYALDADTLFFTVSNDSLGDATDVVIIKKTNEQVFESVDCGPRYRHTIQEVLSTHNFIDSLVVNKSLVSEDASQENILIYLH